MTQPEDITMLVLSRKLGERIVIGDNIVLTVVKIDRNQIRLGIEAPRDVAIYRDEIRPQPVATGIPIRRTRAALATQGVEA
jgi:carbon storage regulator